MTNLAAELTAAIPALASKDQDFARSMLGRFRTKGSFSDGQLPYVKDLIERANNADRPMSAKPNHAALDLSLVNQMFDSARAHGKKRMALRFLDEKGWGFKVSPAAETSANPGCLYVKSAEIGYVGKITPKGEFKGAYGTAADAAAQAQAALVRFCQDPKKAAVEYGTKTESCMFCGLTLTDPRSKSVKYGPICAENYGLPWGA